VKRREFITLLGAAAAWPLAARAQQGERMRRIGVLMGVSGDDPETKARIAAFRWGLERRGWLEGRNAHLDYRFSATKSSPSGIMWLNINDATKLGIKAELVDASKPVLIGPEDVRQKSPPQKKVRFSGGQKNNSEVAEAR
jgi:hypothetical protein